MSKKIALYFGTFNPIHLGHIIIANHFAEYSDLQEVWLVVTPCNPFKKKSELISNYHRLEMVYLATHIYDNLRPSDIEFKLPQPNYTINTLAYISEKYPSYSFGIIMGEDNLKSFHKWKNYKAILDNYQVYVYPRISKGMSKVQFSNHPKIKMVKAPIIQISSTAIRSAIKQQKSVRPLLPTEVWKYIDQMNFYKN
ncbi:MAG: nicotinate (nicotinamide) nucleotide adenylyltransferase [Tenacibaculum sp.]